MKKELYLILLSLFFLSCKENKPKGIWLQVKNKPLTEKNGFSYYSSNSIMDFEKLQRTDLVLPKDSIFPFSIDVDNKIIRNNLRNKQFKYQLYRNDSLEIYYENDNLVEVFIPIGLDKIINLEKKQIEDFLINKQFYAVGNNLKLSFSDENIQENSISDEYQNVRVLNTKNLKNDSFKGYWFVRKVEQSFFLILDFDMLKQNIYQIESLNEKKIKLNGLNTDGIVDSINALKYFKK